MNARMTPPVDLRQAMTHQVCDVLAAENAQLFETLRQIASADSRDGLWMKEEAAYAVNRILETRADMRIRSIQ